MQTTDTGTLNMFFDDYLFSKVAPPLLPPPPPLPPLVTVLMQTPSCPH